MRSRTILAGVFATAFSAAVAFAASPSFHFPASTAQSKSGTGYETKTFTLPPGTIRVITFKAGTDGAYKLDGENQFLVLSGAVEAEVGGKKEALVQGDVASGATGSISHKGASGEAVIVAHKVQSSVDAPKPAVVKGADTKPGPQIQWMGADGKPQSAANEEAAKAANAPANATRFAVQRYTFDGNSIRVISIPKGGRTNPSSYTTDNVMYVAKGKLKRNVGGQIAEVKAGDAVQEQNGTSGFWEVEEDAVMISTTAITKK